MIESLKIAILLVGEMRNYDNINIINNNNMFLFKKYNCDVFISTWEHRGFSPQHGNIKLKKYSNDQINIDTIKTIYPNIKDILIENFDSWLNNLNENQKLYYSQNYIYNNNILNATVFPQLYKLYSANEMKKKYEIDHNFKYDIVLKFRPDFCLTEDIPFLTYNNLSNNILISLNPHKIYYPNRIYDIFFFSNSYVMDIIANTYNYIIDYINDNFNNGLPKNDTGRILFITAIKNNLTIIEIKKCIGDIYRDEPFDVYLNKIKFTFN